MIADKRTLRVRLLGWGAALVASALSPALAEPVSYAALTAGPHQVRLLPGCKQFTFSMYGCPGDEEGVRRLVAAMREFRLGNGFDPGPGVGPSSRSAYEYLRDVGWPVVGYAQTADHQVQEGTCRLTDEQEQILKILSDAGVFAATQLGEWGYYFHNLARDEAWWRAVYGAEFEERRAQLKPADLNGYDRMPASRQECYAILENYFRTRQRAMRGWNLSVTGHSHYEAYAGQWSAKVIGLELGENIAFTQSKIAFARGAARRNGLPWSAQVSPWFAGSMTTSGDLTVDASGVARGLDAGHSLSFYRRMWLHAWFAGAAMVTPEASSEIFFERENRPQRLTSHGRAAAETFQFMSERERGVPYTPIAIVLDQYAGYNPYMGKPWGVLTPTAGDREVRALFEEQLFPDSDHIHHRPFPDNPEASYLRPTPYGELFDVQLSDAPAEVLGSYATLLLAGDHEFSSAFVDALHTVLQSGRRVLVAPRHAETLGQERLAELSASGRLELLEPWTDLRTGRAAAISPARLSTLCQEHAPLEVLGDPVQWQVNRTPRGWVIELVNNAGVVKFPTKPAETDAEAIAQVLIRPLVEGWEAFDWSSGEGLATSADAVPLAVGPGDTRFVEIVERPAAVAP